MEWIRKHYDQFLLLLMALVLLALSFVLIINARNFTTVFDSIRGDVPRNTEVKPLDMQDLKQAQDSVASPASWKTHPGSLFVSAKYVLIDGVLKNPRGESFHGEVSNEWLEKYKLDILSTTILEEDADKDGFTNFDEFKGETDPTVADSHPPYHSKLCVKQVIKQPFRLKFAAYSDNEFQINTLDVRQPSQIGLKVNDAIAGTKFVIKKFEEKHVTDANDLEKDVSELTIQHTETGESLVLVYDKIGDSPDSYALFSYRWNNTDIQVKKDQKFVLKPDIEDQYKLVDIKEDGSLIENLKTGDKITVPRCQDMKR